MADSKKRARALAWLVPPLLLLAVIAAAALVIGGGPVAWLGAVGALLFGIPIAWVLVSVLWPSRAERTCPRCGADALERTDARSTVGLACARCGYRDETSSAWLLAEEEGPLEDIVLEQRGRLPRRSGGGGSAVDSSPSGD